MAKLTGVFNHDLGGAELRLLEHRHATAFLGFVTANRAHLSVWLGWGETVQTLEDAERFIARGRQWFHDDALPWVGVWLDDALGGGALFFPLEATTKATEIGFWLGAGAEGKGLMSKTVRALLGYVFDDLGLNRVVLRADVGNLRSQAMAERLGFQREDVERQSWLLHDELRDNVRYSLLRSEWDALRS